LTDPFIRARGFSVQIIAFFKHHGVVLHLIDKKPAGVAGNRRKIVVNERQFVFSEISGRLEFSIGRLESTLTSVALAFYFQTGVSMRPSIVQMPDGSIALPAEVITIRDATANIATNKSLISPPLFGFGFPAAPFGFYQWRCSCQLLSMP
jgi:hypothetical protein